jgi:hypothetical protein
MGLELFRPASHELPGGMRMYDDRNPLQEEFCPVHETGTDWMAP